MVIDKPFLEQQLAALREQAARLFAQHHQVLGAIAGYEGLLAALEKGEPESPPAPPPEV
jgi:hypothetical protein